MQYAIALALLVISLTATPTMAQLTGGGGGTPTWTSSGTSNSHGGGRCSSTIYGNDWKPASTAPRDGTVVEMAETYGTAPWYGVFKYVNGHWQKANSPNEGVSEDECLFWRPYKSNVAAYKDPTGGAQNTVKYWCDHMHIKYDAKKDVCVP